MTKKKSNVEKIKSFKAKSSKKRKASQNKLTALALIDKMQNAERMQKAVIRQWEKTGDIERFIKDFKKYDKQGDEAYATYYHLMNNNFDVESNKKVSYKKYKNGFCDKNYCKAMFKQFGGKKKWESF